MSDVSHPAEGEAQHIGTFWVLNFDRSEPEAEPQPPPTQHDHDPGWGQAKGVNPAPVPYTTHDREPGRGQALGGSGVGQAPALARIVPRIPATFMRVGPEVAQELARAMDLGDTEPVLQRFARGCHCYIGRSDGKVVTYGWVTFDKEPIGELGLSFHLQAGEAYIWDCATLAAFRGQRLYPALLAFMLSELYRAGMQRIWIGADADNLASQSGFILAGFTPVADILMTRGGTPRELWIRGRPGVSEEIVADVRHALFGNT